MPTLSVTEYPPFLLARLVNSLDHVTEGRAGWNCVTSSNDGAAQNYGREAQVPHDERYELAEEFTDLVTKLWDAWEPDAVVLDRETPMFADGNAKFTPLTTRAGISGAEDRSTRAALPAGQASDLSGRWLAARPTIRRAMG